MRNWNRESESVRIGSSLAVVRMDTRMPTPWHMAALKKAISKVLQQEVQQDDVVDAPVCGPRTSGRVW